MRSNLLRSAMFAAFALVMAACSETAPGPTGMRFISATASNVETATIGDGTLDNPLLWYRRVWLCKSGTDATFEVSVNGGAPVQHALTAGSCKMVSYNDGGQEDIDTVTVTELQSSLFVLDSIARDSTHNEVRFSLPTLTGTNTVTLYTYRSKGAIVTFYNSAAPPPPPSGGEGCTPGYWKQSQHFDSWSAPYAPNTLFSDVFADAFPGQTLLQVLGNGGGGLDALGRHTVAALLNTASASVEYDLSTAGVISAFNTAYANGAYEAQKNIFASFNEQGCPIN